MDELQQNTSGFYRIQDNELQWAPNFVYAPDYELHKEQLSTYELPLPGNWIWADSEELAKQTLGI